MAHRMSKRTPQWAVAAALLVPLAAGCAGNSEKSEKPEKSPTPSAEKTEKGEPAEKGEGGQGSVAGAVAGWTRAVIAKDVREACLHSVVPGSKAKPKAPSPQTCDKANTEKMTRGIAAMSKAFTPKNGGEDPTVKVDAPTPDADTATVPTAKVTVDGKPLRKIILEGSQGVNPETFRAKIQTARIDGKWYVGDFDMDLGTTTLKPQRQ